MGLPQVKEDRESTVIEQYLKELKYQNSRLSDSLQCIELLNIKLSVDSSPDIGMEETEKKMIKENCGLLEEVKAEVIRFNSLNEKLEAEVQKLKTAI